MSAAADMDLQEINKKIKNKTIEKIDQGRLADEVYRAQGSSLREKVESSVKNTEKERSKIEKKLKKSLQDRVKEADEKYREKTNRVYKSFQENKVQKERIEKYTKDLYEKVGPSKDVHYDKEDFSAFGSAVRGIEPDVEKKDSLLEDPIPYDERLYIFMSASVPENIWKTYAEDLKNIGSKRIIIVLRGCIGPQGCTYIKPTLEFLQKVIFNNGNETRGVEIQIDPYLFRRYKVKVVPTFVYVKGLKVKDPSFSEGLEENIESDPEILVLKGDISIRGAVEKFLENADFDGLKKLDEIFRGF
ncbi:TrbC family F-type conjugative pilus assembly protein [Persephonella sp. KM09-Lau-8]|uniref:TrbC family F-type conjugative pilus assembly protein n=1 Tax=Persephonella sp. KM09-Lau-8 TaxID=1158345 RepID=UPI0018CC7508|nr:TrbC family F-type conjugative pilus assembly protein [Persephonella sp. KM09-Lau-8]